MTWKSIGVVLMLAGTAMVSGCGGSGGDSGPNATTAVVAFSAISSSTLPVRIDGIHVEAVLPSGVSVTTDPANPGQISATSLVAGSALDTIPATDKLVVGSYSSTNRLVSISVDAATGFGPGEYVRLTCVVATGVTVTESGIAALNSPPTAFTVSGYSSGSTVDLTGYLTPRFALK
jgi:hypothetical protein